MSWIKAYVPDLDVTAQEYTDAMTLSGTKVEGFERFDEDVDQALRFYKEKVRGFKIRFAMSSSEEQQSILHLDLGDQS